MSKVLVIDTEKRPRLPIHPAQARQLLRNGKAAIFRKFPFTIILKEASPDASVQPLRIKIDPGAKTTGIAVVNDSTGAVNATRFKLLEVLRATGLPVETGSGGLTKFNRIQQELEKTHWIDAAVVGKSTPEKLIIKGVKPLLINAVGHGSRQSCRTDKYGFPNRHVPREKIHFGFQTGDIVKAVVKTGKKVGTYVGKVAIRSSGSFNISTKNGLIQGISHRFCKAIHKKDGYSYAV
ncbi:RRXRR domain-containing protein [Iningainema tapete]|uniref:RRXRR domain-containing protein n=1 Tax=Iningainema tapete BLCC-T55 TaxID=2748662 RepID=A0A8J7C435_9CYAN|nr:RRXRR domain-containing protein [Iningainema tapete]MBD2770879.1 RRXRR domain-containing protein [Iningainema tapete BLCC-T55]